MAVKLAGVKPGDKVFCSDMTFDANLNPVVYESGEPVFVDTEYDTWNMDPAALEKAFELYLDVKTVVIAHLCGIPGKMDELKVICDRHRATIIEDAAENSEPNFWLPCMIIDSEAMCWQAWSEQEAVYISEPDKKLPD